MASPIPLLAPITSAVFPRDPRFHYASASARKIFICAEGPRTNSANASRPLLQRQDGRQLPDTGLALDEPFERLLVVLRRVRVRALQVELTPYDVVNPRVVSSSCNPRIPPGRLAAGVRGPSYA